MPTAPEPDRIAPEAAMMMIADLIMHQDAVPAGCYVRYVDRFDSVTKRTTRTVHIHPSNVDPLTFDFGTPGAYATLSVQRDPYAPERIGYHVAIFATHVAYTFQRAGRVVTFTDPAEAISKAAWLVETESGL